MIMIIEYSQNLDSVSQLTYFPRLQKKMKMLRQHFRSASCQVSFIYVSNNAGHPINSHKVIC